MDLEEIILSKIRQSQIIFHDQEIQSQCEE